MGVAAGYPVVLTADEALTAAYPLLFDGVLVANQTTVTPHWLVRALLMPRAHGDGDRARVAPLGLRRIEAALAASGLGRDEVAVVAGQPLVRAVGPATRIIAVSTGDPLGLGMSTTTATAIAGGRAFTASSFARLMKRIQRLRNGCADPPALVIGGPGAWQLALHDAERRRLGVDCVVTGYAEGNVADIFRRLIDRESVPASISGEPVRADRIPRILGASTMGVIEASRGCGLGCSFCSLAHTPMQHLPVETIIADAETNRAAFQKNLCVISEDILRYGGSGTRANPAAVIDLFSQLRKLSGDGLIQTDHANILSVAQFTDAELGELRALMVGRTGQRLPWINVGIETASGRLLRANGCAAKMGEVAPEEWPDFCAAQLRRLCGAGFLPFASLVVGLPGETDEDTRRTLDWALSLAAEPIAIFPVIYAPLDGTQGVTGRQLSHLQWRLIRECYRRSVFRLVPQMYWDAQRAAGIGAARRLTMAALGRGQAALWKVRLAHEARRSRRALAT